MAKQSLNKKQTLLEKAKKRTKRYKNSQDYDDQQQCLALEWAKSNVTLTQVAFAMDFNQQQGSRIYCFLAQALRSYIQNNPEKFK